MTQSVENNNAELAMYDFSIDELPDLPEFVVWPAGVYKVEGVSLKAVSLGDKSGLKLTVKLESVEAVKPADAKHPELGTEYSWNFLLEGKSDRATEFAQGKVKHLLAPFKVLTQGNGSLPAIAQVVPGAKFSVVTTVSVSKLTDEQKAAGQEARVNSNLDNIILA